MATGKTPPGPGFVTGGGGGGGGGGAAVAGVVPSSPVEEEEEEGPEWLYALLKVKPLCVLLFHV